MEIEDTDPTGDSAGTSGGSDSASDSTGSADESSGSGAGSASGGGSDTAGLDAVEEACEADCEAQFATECAPTNHNVLTCKLNCASITVQLGDFCLGEYTDWVQCRADGGYDCVNGYPTPKSTCAAEQAAHYECTKDLGCKRLCDDAVEAGCGGASFDTCLTACLDEHAALPEYCALQADGVALCKAQGGIECVDGQPTTSADCTYVIVNVGDCIADENDDDCQGWCYVADELACAGGNCTADCESRRADPTCGPAFQSLMSCGLLHGDLACTEGGLQGIDICDSEAMQYEMCMAG